MKATPDGQMLFGERGGEEPHSMTDPAREKAENWLLFRFTNAHRLEEIARIAADFAEHMARVERQALDDEAFPDQETGARVLEYVPPWMLERPLPWAAVCEAMEKEKE